MDKQNLTDAITLGDIITQKLQGIANKIEIVANNDSDNTLELKVNLIIKYQKNVSKLLDQYNAKDEL